MKKLRLYKIMYGIQFVYKNDGHNYEYLAKDLFETEETAKECALEIWDRIKCPGDFLLNTRPVFFTCLKQID